MLSPRPPKATSTSPCPRWNRSQAAGGTVARACSQAEPNSRASEWRGPWPPGGCCGPTGPDNEKGATPGSGSTRMRTLTEQIAPDLAANAQALKNMLVHDLLRGVALDESTHLQQARKLGLDLNRPRVVILIDASHYISGQDASLSWSTPRQGVTRQRVAMALDLVGRHFRDTSEAIWAYTGDGEIAVL